MIQPKAEMPGGGSVPVGVSMPPGAHDLRRPAGDRRLVIVLVEWRPFAALQETSLGLQYMAAALKQAGHGVHTLILERMPVEDACRTILSLQPDVVGLALFREAPNEPFQIARKLKAQRPGVAIVMGGHIATLYAAHILTRQPAIDVVVCGEGELTMVELCERLWRGDSLQDCEGIYYRRDGRLHRTAPRELLSDLDALPRPDLEALHRRIHPESPTVFVAVSTSRGCLGQCDFCVENRHYRQPGRPRWRGRSPENVVDEIEQLCRLFAGKRLVLRFVDGSFEDPEPAAKVRLREMADLLQARGLQLAFSFYTRGESWREDDVPLVQQMRQLGLFEVQIGFESGSADSLRAFNKRASVEDNLRSASLFAAQGVHAYGYLIQFHPYIRLDGLRENASFIMKVGLGHLPVLWYHSLILFPDTPLFRRIVADGLLLGSDASGYAYLYAFEDGRVAGVYEAMQKVGNLRSRQSYEETVAKVNLELQLYAVWRERLDEMAQVRDEMAAYGLEVRRIRERVAVRQHALFLELLDAAEANGLQNVEARVVEDWDALLEKDGRQIESAWMRCRMQLGRRGVRLI